MPKVFFLSFKNKIAFIFFVMPKNSNENMTVWEAIHEMRLRSQRKQAFSFAFMSFSIEKQYSEGIIQVSKGYLTLREREEQNKYAEHFLSYYDCNLQKTRHFWQPLLIEFNGTQLELK